MVEDVEIVDRCLIGDVSAGGSRYLVEYGEGVAHGTVGLGCYNSERGRFGFYAFSLGYKRQVVDHVLYRDAVEIVDLASREDGGYDLVLFRCGEDENHVGRRFFKGFQECVECGR